MLSKVPILLVLVLAANPAESVPAGGAPESLHLRVEAETDAPLFMGARAAFEFPRRLRVSTAVGYVPAFYVRTTNRFFTAMDAYDEETARLIEDALTSSLVWRTQLGWRPFRRAGFYFEGGFGLVTLGGSVSSGTVIAHAHGIQVPDWLVAGHDFNVETTLHMAGVELGWEGKTAKQMTWRVALGWSYTAGSRTVINPTFEPLWPIEGDVREFCRDSEKQLDDEMQEYFHPPTVIVGIGWEFF